MERPGVLSSTAAYGRWWLAQLRGPLVTACWDMASGNIRSPHGTTAGPEIPRWRAPPGGRVVFSQGRPVRDAGALTWTGMGGAGQESA